MIGPLHLRPSAMVEATTAEAIAMIVDFVNMSFSPEC
jgi:hypothetical protein